MSWRDQYDEVQDSEIWYRDFEALKHLHGPVKQLYRNDFPQPDLSLLKIRKGEWWGVADADGRVILSPEWEGVGPLPESGGFLIWQTDDTGYNTLAGLADASGRILLKPCCYMVLRVEAERALVVRRIDPGNSYACEAVWLNWEGAVVDRPAWAFVTVRNHPFSSGITRITMDGKVNYIDLTGRILCETWWDDMGEFGGANFFHSEDRASSLTWARQGERFGFVSRTGETVIPPIFEDAKDFGNGFDGSYFEDSDRAAVKWQGKWGFIDETGALVVDCRWDAAKPFSDGSAYVWLDGVEYRINRQGFIRERNEGPAKKPSRHFFFEGDTLWAQAVADTYLHLTEKLNDEGFGSRSFSPKRLFHYLAGRIPILDLLENIPTRPNEAWQEDKIRLYHAIAPDCLHYLNHMSDCTLEEKLALDRVLLHAADRYLAELEALQ